MATSVIAAANRIKCVVCRHEGDLKSSFLFEFICMLSVPEYCLALGRSISEGKPHGNDPAMVVLVKLRYRDLYTNTKGQVKSLREWKRA